jgi:tetratricopeptide (TPR) repeat protein
VELDPKNFDAIYALGVVYNEATGFAGGNKKKAVEYFRSAIEVDSNYTLPYIDLAKYYINTKKIDGAKMLLNRLMMTENPVYPTDYFLKDKPKASKLLAKIEEKK